MDDRLLLKSTKKGLCCPKCGEGRAIATDDAYICMKCGDRHALRIQTAAELLLSEPTVRQPENARGPSALQGGGIPLRKRHPIYGDNEPPRVVWPEASEKQEERPPRQGEHGVGNGVNPQQIAALRLK